MTFGLSAGNGLYEQWASRLAAWANDPRTSLDGLPPLTDDGFDQRTYLRLMGRTNDAISVFMAGWKSELTRSFSTAKTDHELGAELVRLRQLLRPRLTLAEHPGWPEVIRTALLEGLRSDLSAIQEELEKAGGKTSAGGRLDRARSDELVAVIRRNPLTLLTTFSPPAAPMANSPADTATRPGRRILF